MKPSGRLYPLTILVLITLVPSTGLLPPAPVAAQPRPVFTPRVGAGPTADEVVRALAKVASSRRSFVTGAFHGDRAFMARADSVREHHLDVLNRADPALINTIPWPDRWAWLALALKFRQAHRSLDLLEHLSGFPEPGSPQRGPIALVVGLTAFRLMEGSPEDDAALVRGRPLLDVAQEAFRVAAEDDFLLRDEAFYHLWNLAEGEGDTLEAVAWADSLAEHYPRSTRCPRVRLTRARALLAAGEPGRARAEARLALPAYDGPDLRWLLASASLDLGFPRQAARELEHLITTFGTDPLALRAWTRLRTLAEEDSTLALSPLQRMGLLVALLANPESGAVDSLLGMIANPDEPAAVRDQAALMLSRSFYRTKTYHRAEPLLRDLLDAEDPDVAEEGRLILARILRNTGRLVEMARHYQAVTHGGGKNASRALWEWGREMESQSQWAEAEALYTDYIERFPRSQRYRDVLFRRGFDRIRQGKDKLAAEDFRAALGASGRQSQEEQAAFWLARTLMGLGDEEGAYRVARAGAAHPEPSDGYGVLLRTRFLGEVMGNPDPDTVNVSEEWLFDAIDPAEWPEPVREHYARGLRLVEMGQTEAGRREWSRAAGLGKRFPSLLQSLALMAAAHNIYPEGIRWASRGRKALPAGHPNDRGFERLAYPAAYYRDVIREANRNGVDPWSLWALMRQESFYDPLAVSRAGALGLMQVMPYTLQRMTNESGEPAMAAEALFIPRVNIAMGTRFFSDRLEEFDRHLLPTLASYNAGENKSWEWLKRADGNVEEIFIETIGYPETYDYVRRILWLIWVYEAYYGAAPASLPDGLQDR